MAAGLAGYGRMVTENSIPFERLLETLKRAAGALREADLPFALGGGVAVWAHGGPETEHDLDLFVKPEDAERALEVLAAEGFRPEKPPEGWLYKAWDGDVLVDLIFEPSGMEVDDRFLHRAQELEVNAVRIPVALPKDVRCACACCGPRTCS